MKYYVQNPFLNILAFILLFLFVFSPTENMSIKIMLALLFATMGFLYALHNISSIRVSRGVFYWFAIYISAGIFFTLLSFLYENPQPTNFVNVYVVGPTIYFLIIILINERGFRFIEKALTAALVFTLIYNIVYALSLNGILPEGLSRYMPYVKENLGGLNLGFIKITAQNISWLLFLIPYFIAAYLKADKGYSKLLVVGIIFGGLLIALLTVRTAFLLGIAITPIIVLVGSIITHTRLDKLHILISIGFVCILVLVILGSNSINFIGIIKRVFNSFSNNVIVNEYGIKDNGGAIRYEQLRDLILTWTHKPILGWGDSASAINVIRSDTAGSYELTYVAMLMQRGIVGIVIFGTQIIWIYMKGINIIKHSMKLKNSMFCTLVGYTVFIFANATNPYVHSFDRLLILFYPLIIINQYELYEKVK